MGRRKAGGMMVELLGRRKRARSAWKERAESLHVPTEEARSPDLEPGREASHIWVSYLERVCSKVGFKTTYNRVMNYCPSKKSNKPWGW